MPLGLAAILSGVLPFLGQELGQAAAKETVKRGFDQATGKNKDRDKPVQFQMVDAQGLPVGYNQGGSFGPPTTLLPNQPVQQPVPLGGFAKALTGPPTDTQKFKEARVALMKHIAERQKKLVAELKKQQEDLNKMQPNVKGEAEKKKK